MCWNVPSSLAGFLVGCSVGGYVYHIRAKSIRDLWLGSFLVIFSLVQLMEAFLWQWGDINPSALTIKTLRNADAESCQEAILQHERLQECNQANQFISGYLLPTILVFEVTSQIMRAYMYWHKMRTASWKLILLSVTWTALGVQYRYPAYVAPRPLCSTSYGSYLLWGDVPYSNNNKAITLHFLLGTFGIALPFLILQKCGVVYFLFTVSTSLVVYYVNTPAWASNWCFVALSGSILIVLDPWLFDTPESDLLFLRNKKHTPPKKKRH